MTVNSIRCLLEKASSRYPNKCAIKFGDESYSYSELKERIDKIASYLMSLNLPKGSRVGIYSDKSCSQVIAILATLSTPYTLVPITRLLKPEQVKYIINDCSISCMLTDSKKIDRVKATGFDGEIITFDVSGSDCVSFAEIYKCYRADFSSDIRGHDNAVITYSFSTIGDPKGIVIDHRALFDGAAIAPEISLVASKTW